MKTIFQSKRALAAIGTLVVLPVVLVISLAALHATSVGDYDFRPQSVARQAIQILSSQRVHGESLAGAAWVSIGRVLLCLVTSACVGAVLGVVLCVMGKYRILLLPTVDFFRALPVTFLLAPIAFAIGLTASHVPWVLACLPCSLIVSVCIAERATAIDTERLRVVGVFFGERRRWGLLRHLFVYELLAGFLTGVKLAVPYAVILVGVLEYVGAGSARIGFGHLVHDLSEGKDGEQAMVAVVLLYGLIGLLLVWGSSLGYRRLLAWQEDA